MAPQRRIWLNGSPVAAGSLALQVDDRGFLFGDGVFEVLRARRGVLIEWVRHAARLRRAAAALAIAIPPSDADLADWCRALLESEGLAADGRRSGDEPGDAVVRITLSRGGTDLPVLSPAGGADSTLAIEAWPWEPPSAGSLESGISAIVAAGRRDPAAPLAGVRTTSCAYLVAGRLEASRAGADDAIWLTPAGEVAEASLASVFAIRGSRLVTPPRSAGVADLAIRSWLLRDASVGALGMEAEEDALRLEDLAAADEAFLADDVAGVLPLVSLDGAPIGRGRPGLHTLALRAAREAWIDRVSRGEASDAIAEEGAPAGSIPVAPVPVGAAISVETPLPASSAALGSSAVLGSSAALGSSAGPAPVSTRSSLLARSATMSAADRAELGPEQVFGWAAALTSSEIHLLGRVVGEMLRTGAAPDVGRGFGIAWDGGVRLPRPDQEAMIRDFAELEVTVAGVLAGRDLRAVAPAPPKRGFAALLSIFGPRLRQSEVQASNVIELAGEPAQRGLIALWNAWVAVRYRDRIPPPLFETLVRPWVDVVGPLPER